MKRTIKFWTKEEDKLLLDTLKQSKNQSDAARKLHRQIGRTAVAIQFRLSRLTRGKIAKETKGIDLPKGFTFDIKPNRVVMFNDHIRLYF